MMAKRRTTIPEEIAGSVIYEHEHTCCFCQEPGKTVQIHHIDENPANHQKSNLALLCLECHSKTQATGGFGRHLKGDVVRRARDDWLMRVGERRRKADEIAAIKKARVNDATDNKDNKMQSNTISEIETYIGDIPETFSFAIADRKDRLQSGTTVGIVSSTHELLEITKSMVKNIIVADPGECWMSAGDVDRVAYQRARSHRDQAEPGGPGTGGTIAPLSTNLAVLKDMEIFIEILVGKYADQFEQLDYVEWCQKWRLVCADT